MCDMRLCIGVIVPLHDSVCRRLFVVSTRRQHEIQLALLIRTMFLLVGAQHHCVHISARKPCATYGITIDRTPYTTLTVRLLIMPGMQPTYTTTTIARRPRVCDGACTRMSVYIGHAHSAAMRVARVGESYAANLNARCVGHGHGDDGAAVAVDRELSVHAHGIQGRGDRLARHVMAMSWCADRCGRNTGCV